MTKYLFEVTFEYKGLESTNRVFAASAEEATRNLLMEMVPGVKVTRVKQKTFTPAKVGHPQVH